MEYLATFYTHFAALSFFRALEARGISGRMMPVPRRLSASCGTCVSFLTETDFESLLVEDTEQIFSLSQGEYRCVYQHQDS